MLKLTALMMLTKWICRNHDKAGIGLFDKDATKRERNFGRNKANLLNTRDSSLRSQQLTRLPMA